MKTALQKELTRADRDALSRMPDDKWFHPLELDYMVRSARWRCDRLTSMGLLKSTVVGTTMENVRTLFWKFSDLELELIARRSKENAQP